MSTKLNLKEIDIEIEKDRLKTIKDNTNDVELKKSIEEKLKYINKQKPIKK